MQIEQLVQALHHECSIGTSTAQTSTRGDVLGKAYGHGRNIHVLGTEHVQHPYHKIVLCRAIQFPAVHDKGIFVGRGYLQAITQGDGEEKCLYVMVAIATFAHNVQSKIDLAIRVQYHFVSLYLLYIRLILVAQHAEELLVYPRYLFWGLTKGSAHVCVQVVEHP